VGAVPGPHFLPAGKARFTVKRGNTQQNKGFTLVELMTVIFIVGILAAVGLALMRGRADAAKWTEGRSTAGTIKTAARAYCAEKGPIFNYVGTGLTELGFIVTPGAPGGDLDGRYLSDDCYTIAFTGYDDFLITVDASQSVSPEAPSVPFVATMDDDGLWTE
jgi:prepilin-type N-terminal cleavage/methylation domain-containing protein